MLITPLQLEDEPLRIAATFSPGSIDFTPDITQIGPLTVNGRADLIVEHRGGNELVPDIRVRASYTGELELPCARCVEPVRVPLQGEFDLIFRPGNVDADAHERAITADETEIGYYEEGGLLLEDVVREQVLLSLPGRILCQSNCQGLCPTCGQNRNQAVCTCSDAPADPRWNALAGLAQKLELKH